MATWNAAPLSPAAPTATPTASMIPIANTAGNLNEWGLDAHTASTADVHTQYQKESEKGQASGYASLNGSTLVTENPANATATPTASKIPIADGSGKLDGWVTATATSEEAVKWGFLLGG